MFGRKKTPDAEDVLIERLYDEMKEYGPLTNEFGDCVGYLERLEALKEKRKPSRVSHDTIWLVVGNLVGVVLIVAYEQKHVMTSKAFGTIITPRKTQK